MSYEDDPFGGSDVGAKFIKIGHSYEGQVLDYKVRQQTDMESGEVKTWANGDKMIEVLITLQLPESDKVNWGRTWDWENMAWEEKALEEDDGVRTLYAKSGVFTAVKSALHAAKVKTPDMVGGVLKITYTKNGKPSQKGYNAPKIYEAEFTPGEKPDPFDA